MALESLQKSEEFRILSEDSTSKNCDFHGRINYIKRSSNRNPLYTQLQSNLRDCNRRKRDAQREKDRALRTDGKSLGKNILEIGSNIIGVGAAYIEDCSGIEQQIQQTPSRIESISLDTTFSMSNKMGDRITKSKIEAANNNDESLQDNHLEKLAIGNAASWFANSQIVEGFCN